MPSPKPDAQTGVQSDEIRRRRRGKNLALLGVLAVLVLIIYFVSMVRISQQL